MNMKKSVMISIAAAALMLIGANASAQIGIGIGAGTRIFKAKGIEGARYMPGVMVSFEDSQRVSDYFGYSAGIDFGTYKERGAADKTSGYMTEMYIDIPVRAKFYLPVSDNFELFLFGGPVPSVCLSAHRVTSAGKVNWFEASTNYTRYDVLVGGGIGADIAGHLRVTVGYDYGLLDRDGTDVVNLKMSIAKVGVTYLF